MECLIHKNAALSPYCSMKTGGNAKYLALPKTAAEMREAMEYFSQIKEKFVIVGNCSNLLFKDSGYDGAVIVTTGIKGISVQDGTITAFCGESLSALARTAWENSVTGFEFCYGIPGTVGGGIYMNAGAYGGELSQRFVSGVFLDKNLNEITLSANALGFGYRASILQKEELILISATFKGENGSKEDIRAKMDELMASRKAKQPLEYPSCGSTFKRPKDNFAGALIEQCGLKGFSIGGARVSEKHAGFIVNYDKATSSEVLALMDEVRKIVYEKTGIMLEPEIRIME